MSWQHWVAAFGLFALVYFPFILPLAQRLSLRCSGRRFSIRLGGAWDPRVPAQRQDVLYSLVSFMIALALSMLLFQGCIDLGWLPPAGKIQPS